MVAPGFNRNAAISTFLRPAVDQETAKKAEVEERDMITGGEINVLKTCKQRVRRALKTIHSMRAKRSKSFTTCTQSAQNHSQHARKALKIAHSIPANQTTRATHIHAHEPT